MHLCLGLEARHQKRWAALLLHQAYCRRVESSESDDRILAGTFIAPAIPNESGARATREVQFAQYLQAHPSSSVRPPTRPLITGMYVHMAIFENIDRPQGIFIFHSTMRRHVYLLNYLSSYLTCCILSCLQAPTIYLDGQR